MKATNRSIDLPRPEIQYPLDELGIKPENIVKDEIHTVSQTVDKDYHFIVPKFAPFFTKDFKITMRSKISNEEIVLKEDVDWHFSLAYIGGTRALGQPVYGGISLNNLPVDGVLFVTYHTLGGGQLTDVQKVIQIMLEMVYNPRIIYWDQVSNAPDLYPPETHQHELEDVKRLEDLIASLDEIQKAISISGAEAVRAIDEKFAEFDLYKFKLLMENLEEHSYMEILQRLKRIEVRLRRIDGLNS